MAAAAIRPGMEVERFEGRPVLEYIRQAVSPYLSFSTPQDSNERIYRYELIPASMGSGVSLTLRMSDGEAFGHTLKAIPAEQYCSRYPWAKFQVLQNNIDYLQLNSLTTQE